MILDIDDRIKNENINYGRKHLITEIKEKKKPPKKLLLPEEKRFLMNKFCNRELSYELYNNFYEKERLEKEIKNIHSIILEQYKEDKLLFTIRTRVCKKPFTFYSYLLNTGEEKSLEIQNENEEIYCDMKIFYTLKNIEKEPFVPLSKEIDNKRTKIKSHSSNFLKQKNEIFEKIKEIINLDIKRFVQVQPKIRIVSMKIIDFLEKCDNDYNFHVILDFIPRDKNNISFMIYDEKEFEEYSFNNYDYILNVTIYTNNKIN